MYTDLSVRENLRYFAAVLGAPADDADRVIDEVGLGDARDQLVSGSCPAGRAAARAWPSRCSASPSCSCSTSRPSGWIPCCAASCGSCSTSSPSGGTTLLVSSHVMDEAARCERLLLMREGEILADDTPDALRARTGTQDLEAAFLRLIRTQEIPA